MKKAEKTFKTKIHCVLPCQILNKVPQKFMILKGHMLIFEMLLS